MIWIDRIEELQYYHQPPDAPCYCDLMVYPSDLMLQGAFQHPYSPLLTTIIYVYSPDGLTQLEVASPFFDIYWAQNPITGLTMFNLRLKSFTPAMCANACWVLRVVITAPNGLPLWDKYTERYCQTSCCDVPRGTTIEPEGFRLPPREEPPIIPPPAPVTFCGEKLLRIRTYFDCYDNFTGDFYGEPSTVYAGSVNWAFEKISNIEARIVARPREITREISYNCRLQRSESFRPFLLESTGWEHGLFPPWKMNELENGFHANNIFVSDFVMETGYQFAGGTMFQQVYDCWELFRLNTVLQECTKRQIFGCGEICDGEVAMQYLIPSNDNGNAYFDENKTFIADSYNALLAYFQTQPGVTSIVDTSGAFDNTVHSFTVVGVGYIPTSFFYNSPIQRNRVFGTNTPVPLVVSCEAPVVGVLSMTTATCAAPVVGDISMTEITPLIVPIFGVDNWEVLAGQSTINNGIGLIHLEVFNSTYPVGSPAFPTTFGGEIIASIAPEGRPSTPQFITFEQNENLPTDTAVAIEPSGIIRWFGLPTSYDETGSFVTLIDIVYIL